MIDIAVLMRTKNSDWVISQTLAALFSQDEVKINLYIVDSGSTDTTVSICDRYPHTKIKMHGDTYIPGPVLNAAIEEISEKIIVMLNSDSVLLHPKSLFYLVKPLINDSGIAATIGRQVPRHDAKPWVRKDYAYCFPDTEDLPNEITLSFPLSAIRRSVWEEEKFYEQSWGSEDTEWGKRILEKKKGKIKYIRDAITMHSHNYSNKELHNRKYIEGEADYFIYQKKPVILSNIINYLRRSIGETIYYLKNLSLLSIPTIYVRNLFYFIGYYRGLKNAEHRVKNEIHKVVHKPY